MPRRAFTLIELLVVISIIAALAALALGVIPTMRAGAVASRCANLQRQIGTANEAYSIDWEGAMVATYATNNGAWIAALGVLVDGSTNGPVWQLMLNGCPDWPYSDWFNSPWKNGWWKGYCRNPYLKVCFRNTSESDSAHDLLGGIGYTNLLPAPHTTSQGRWLYRAEMTHVAERIWLGDGWDYYYAPAASVPGDHVDQFRHRGRSVFTFCDGHIERRRASEAPIGLLLTR